MSRTLQPLDDAWARRMTNALRILRYLSVADIEYLLARIKDGR